MSSTFEFKSTLHEVILVGIICMAQVLCQGSITMALSTMDIVLNDFNLTIPESSAKAWYMASFAMTVGTFILIAGKLGDLFGLKLVFNIGWIWCCVSSLLCGLSFYPKSLIFLVVARALQGIGFALLLPCGIGILGNIYNNGFRKNLAFSCVGGAGPIGATLGAIFSSIIAQLSWWPWCFYLISILCISLFILSSWLIPNNVNELPDNKFQRLDYFGSSLGIIGLILLNFVMNQGPLVGWSAPYIIVLLIISIVLLIGFLVAEIRFVKYPLLPKAVFNYKVGLVITCVALGWGSFGIWQFYYYTVLMEMRHYSAIHTALTYIPIMIIGTIAALSVAFLIHRVRPSFIMLASSVGFCIGCILLSIMPVDQSFWKISFIQLFIITWGMDLSFAAGSIILSDCLPKKHQGIAGSLISTVVNYSVSLFLALSNIIQINVHSSTKDLLQSYRAALYFGIGISGLGVMVSILFICLQYYRGDTVLPTTSTESHDSEKEHRESL